MRMKPIVYAAMLLIALSGCDRKPAVFYGQQDNIREFGTIVSVDEDNHVIITGQQVIAEQAASSATGGIISQAFSGLAGSTASSTQTAGIGDAPTIRYVIDKTNGERVAITQDPGLGEAILYPGQKVIIQTNGKYIRVYPLDVENR